MIRVACVSFNNTYIIDFNHRSISVDYFDNLNKIDYELYDFIIILNNQDKVDLIKCLKFIKKNFINTIYIIDYNYSAQTVVQAFRYGAHDYLTYPIKKDYLIQKIINEYQTTKTAQRLSYEFESLYIDFKEHCVYIGKDKINLTRIEYSLLELLINNLNKSLSKDEIYQEIWGSIIEDYRTLETHIKTLRNKLGSYRSNIVTVWSYGYAFMENISTKQ